VVLVAQGSGGRPSGRDPRLRRGMAVSVPSGMFPVFARQISVDDYGDGTVVSVR